MAKGKSEKKGGGAPEDEQEQKLQAILLADSFNTNFRPISSDMPKVGARPPRCGLCVCRVLCLSLHSPCFATPLCVYRKSRAVRFPGAGVTRVLREL